jgi:hypothetical protein
MNCQRFEEVVSELAREQMMEADLRAQALGHTHDCGACMNRLQEEKALTLGLQAWANEMKSAVASVELELRLRQAFRTPESPLPVASMRGDGRYWLSAAAAVLLIVCSVAVVRWRSQKQAPRGTVSAAEFLPVSSQDNESSAAERVAAGKSHTAQIKHKHTRRSQVARAGRPKPSDVQNLAAVNNTQREIATEFMPLGYLNAASFQDGGQIVRVELPRSTLASFGLPVNMDRYNERVKADVVLGVDGVAHAIRFIQ